MKQNKFLSAAIIFVLIAFSTISWVSKPSAPAAPTAVTITGVYDFSTFPHTAGTFTTSGALNLSGASTMDVGPNVNGKRAHCVIVLYPSDGGSITIHQECEFATSPSHGQWEIVSGTGAYANIKGNGSLLMPPMVGNLGTEAMSGSIY